MIEENLSKLGETLSTYSSDTKKTLVDRVEKIDKRLEQQDNLNSEVNRNLEAISKKLSDLASQKVENRGKELYRVSHVLSNALLLTRVVDKLNTVRHFSQVKRLFRESETCKIPQDIIKLARLAEYRYGAPDLPDFVKSNPNGLMDGPSQGTRAKQRKEMV